MAQQKTVRVKLLAPCVQSGEEGFPVAHEKGDVVEFPADDAARLVSRGLAEEVKSFLPPAK
jgi:hypothetical protein